MTNFLEDLNKIFRTEIVEQTEEAVDACVKRVESEGTHRWSAASNTGLPKGKIRLTFLPHSAFRKDS